MEEAPYVLVSGGSGASSNNGSAAVNGAKTSPPSPSRPSRDGDHASSANAGANQPPVTVGSPSASAKQSPSFSYAELFHAPLKWGAAATELVASTTEKMALTTMNVTMKTASALASTTEGVAAVVANKTANVAMNTAAITTQAFDLAASTTSNAVHATSDAVVGTANMVVGGLSSTASSSAAAAGGSFSNHHHHHRSRGFNPISGGPSSSSQSANALSSSTAAGTASATSSNLNPPTSPLLLAGGHGTFGKRGSSRRPHHSPEHPTAAGTPLSLQQQHVQTPGDVIVAPVPEAALLLGRRVPASSVSSSSATGAVSLPSSVAPNTESSIQKFGSKLLCLLGASTVAARKQWVRCSFWE